MLKVNQTRGVVQLVVVAWVFGGLLVAGIAYEYAKIISPGRNTKTADKLAVATATTQTQAVTINDDAEKLKQQIADATKAHEAENKVHLDIETNGAGFVYAAIDAMKSDINPTRGEIVALALAQNAQQALGDVLTPSQRAMWDSLVVPLLKDDAKAWATVEAMKTDAVATQASLAAVSEQSKSKDATIVSLSTGLATETKAHVATASVAAKLGAENKTWADDAETLWTRIKALGWLSVFLVLLAIFLGVKFLGVKNTLGDATALIEFVKGEAVKAGHDAVSLDQKIHAWWDGSSKENVVTKIKTDVLRQ